LSLIGASDYVFVTDNLKEDAKIRFELLSKTKKALLGDHGMRRYNEFTVTDPQGNPIRLHDSYLNIAWHFPKEKIQQMLSRHQLTPLTNPNISLASQLPKDKSSSDASDLGSLVARQELSDFKYTAQWQIGLSASLQGLNKAKQDLLKAIESQGAPAQETDKALLNQINHEILDTLNRNIAAIPGPLPGTEKIMRADGTEYPPYEPLEAYEVFPDTHGVPKFIPGSHSLPWHKSQLFDGIRKTIDTLEQEESLKKQGLL
jgi:hypothetical protein